MRIVSAASAFPEHYYPQSVLLDALREFWKDQLPHPRMLDRLYATSGVDGRHLVRPMECYYDIHTWGQANNIWIETALDLGEKAVCSALSRAGIDAQRIGAIFFVSVTGVASPSIDARLINRMRLSPNLRRTPIFGLGCVAGAAGVARAADYVRAYPDQIALLLSVELCSLTLQRADLSPANLISSSLFGDGVAAVLIAGSACGLQGPEILGSRSSFYPDTEDVMGWDISEKGFQIVLSREVPNVVREHLGADADALLAQHGLQRSDIGAWVLHTGGPKVLEATEDALGLPRGHLKVSWDSLRKVGNLSSASVLVVLEEVMTHHRPPPGTYGIMAALGPGFCSEILLLRW